MADRQLADEALPLLSTVIGMIMEDEVDAAVTALGHNRDERSRHFATLAAAGRDIAALAAAGEILLRRYGSSAAQE